MTQCTDNLNHVTVASPCAVDWADMSGNDQVRFCGHCQLNVYNLSAMTTKDAQTLVAQTEGKRCVRFYRREDGTMLTQDCPMGFREKSRHLLKIASVMVAGLLGGWIPFVGLAHAETLPPPGITPQHNWGPEMPQHTMGELMVPEHPPYQKPPVVQPVTPNTNPHPIQVTPQKPALPDTDHKSETIRPFVRFQPLLACEESTDGKVTTMALGEEGGPSESPDSGDDTKVTTMMVGEEGGHDDTPPPSITDTSNESGQGHSDKPFTTMALGEEGGK